MTAEELQSNLHDQFAALAHRHATVSYALIGILAVVLLLAGVGGYIALRFADAQIARAERMEEKYNADRQVWQDKLEANEKARAEDAAKQQVLVKVIHDRDTTADAAIHDAVKPDASLETVRAGLQASYSDVPQFGAVEATKDGRIALARPQAQQITASRLNENRLTLDLGDTKTLLSLEQHRTLTMQTDLTTCRTIGLEADATIKEYKKAAVRSKFKKFVSGATKVVIFVGGVYLGHKL